MSAVVPLDPASPHGRAIATRWSRTLAIIEHEIKSARQSKPPKDGTPAPSPAPKPKPKPTGPSSPAKATGRAA